MIPRREPKNYTEEQYFRSKDEMFDLFSDIPEALINTVKIAEKCNIDLELGKFYLLILKFQIAILEKNS